jgi:predicted RNase H-like nuclease (RuvC/YqgF family)
MDWNTIIIAIVGGMFVPVGKAIFDYLKDKNKDQNTAADIVVDSSIKVMAQLEKRIESLECEIKKLKKREAKYARNQKELISVVNELKSVMKEQGIDYDIEPVLEDVEVE